MTDAGASEAERIGARLAAAYCAIAAGPMADAPICNPALAVEALGFTLHEGCAVGVVVTPWFAGFIAAPLAGAPPQRLRFPAGALDFVACDVPGFGQAASCSLFSPMDAFATQDDARAAARAALGGLFDPGLHAPPPRPALDRRALFGLRSGAAS